MKTYLDCYPCFLRQALEAARMAGADEVQRREVLDRVLNLLKQVDPTSSPPEIGDHVHRIVRQEVGDGDPYQALKQASTRQALQLYPRMRALLAQGQDSLEVAVRLSIAGNIIDAGPNREYDLWATVEQVLTQPFAVDDGSAFREVLSRVDRMLYLADNAGETVFDRVLIESLDVPVTYVVKGGPTLNDATWEDAMAAGIDQVADIIDTGLDAPGTILQCTDGRTCSDEFRRIYDEAELIIAKGQANYETLSEEGSRVFFLLKVKCPIIARDVGVPVGSIVFKRGRTYD
jgi:uncharacterized protein with ATP-grasp and redox domains